MTVTRRVRARRGAGAVLVLASIGAVAWTATGGAVPAGAQAGTGIARPDISPTSGDIRLLGVANEGAPGEAWALSELQPSQRVMVGSEPLAVGNDRRVLLRHTDSAGWEVAGVVTQPDGTPRTTTPQPLLARVGGRGTVLMALAAGSSTTLALGDATTGVREIADPPTGPTGFSAGEALADSTRVAMAVSDAGGTPVVYAGALGPTRERAILRRAGGVWSRETVDLPASGTFRILAIAVAPNGSAWMLARAAGSGIALYQRDSDAVWRARSLGTSPFASDAPGDGVTAVQPLESPAESLTATNDGVWADGRLLISGATRTFTLFYRQDTRTVSESFCNVTTLSAVSLCSRPLGSELSRLSGYRSYAWTGDGVGTRVVTDPVGVTGERTATRGTYLVFRTDGVARVPGAGGTSFDPVGGAFLAPDRGWLGGGGVEGTSGASTPGRGAGVTEIRPAATPARLENWPVALRRPLTAIAGEPGRPPGDLQAAAIAVGVDGAVARYLPDGGWRPEPLLDGAGVRATPRLRGVAWPVPARAYAVGDGGEMWLWRQETGLWERDEGAPLELDGNLMGVAFAPGSDSRGYAVGRRGLILRFDKSWIPDTPPSGLADRDVTSIAFAGNQAIAAAGRDVLINDGGAWRVDEQAATLLRDVNGTAIAAAGLPDGGAVVAGDGVVLVRQTAGAPWRLTEQPLGRYKAVAAAAYRDAAGVVRAVVSVTGQQSYPADVDQNVVTDPSAPPPTFNDLPLPAAGFLLRQTPTGWADEQHDAYRPSGQDLPLRPDPRLALLLDSTGSGWIVGGETGQAFGGAGRQTQTASITRYPPSGIAPPGAGAAVEQLPSGPIRFAIGGHAACRETCWDLGAQQLGPDVNLVAARQRADELSTQPDGVKAFLYTGARVEAGAGGLSGPDATRFAQLSAGKIGFFPALGPADAEGAAGAFRGAFTNGPTPLGFGPLPDGLDVSDIPGGSGDAGARTHYAFDVGSENRAVRVVVIDNAAGSLQASDPHQNPAEPQLPWLRDVLRGAKRRGIPAIVVGNRDLNTASASTNVASDASEVAAVLVAEGASAYFFDRPDENRTYRIPAGAAQDRSIPTFGTGSLGYGPITEQDPNLSESGFLLAEVDVARRDASTNRAPVTASLFPVISQLSLDAIDGNVIRRSRTALFQGLGRRPLGGIRNPGSDPGPDPYIKLPADPCRASICNQKVDPRVRFSSSRPDIGDFVRRDVQSTSPRAILLDADDKPIADATSPLFCAYNAGTTTITISAGNLTFSQEVRVQSGSVQRPCGTRPLVDPPAPANPQANVEVAPDVEPGASPPPEFAVPALPPAPAPAPAPASPAPPVSPLPALASVPALAPTAGFIPTIPPPPVQPVPRPTPPSGTASVRVHEEKREEEEAFEQSSAAVRYEPGQRVLSPGSTLAFVLLAAAAGSTVARRRRVGRRPVALNWVRGRRHL